MHGGRNPVTKIERYRKHAPKIRFLTLRQVRDQLDALSDNITRQTIVAVYICAGLRREEAIWLTLDDIDLAAGTHGLIRVLANLLDGEAWEPKTKVNRAVPISASLRKYPDRYQPRIVPGHWYFPSPKGKRWNPDNFGRILRETNRKLVLSCTNKRNNSDPVFCVGANLFAHVSTDRYCGFPLSRE